MDLAVEEEEEEAAAVLRAHGALHSLHFAAGEGMTDEVAARIAAGQDVNARVSVSFLCVWLGGRVVVAASIVYTSCIFISLLYIIHSYIYIYTYIYIHICLYIYISCKQM